MAAIDRVVHHSVILDMMEVESYRATEANHHRKLQQEVTKIEAQKPCHLQESFAVSYQKVCHKY
jgi:hypothetical protein